MESHLESDPIEAAPPAQQRHWLGLPVVVRPEDTIESVLASLPHFGRQPFTLASTNGEGLGINPFLDVIYRVAVRPGDTPIPVGVVSKNYRLVDHYQVLRTVQESLVDCRLELKTFQVRAQSTIHGERAHFSILFPPEDRFMMHSGNKNGEMRFRIEIFNSVEGSYRLTAIAGWLRFVCWNGLIVGTRLASHQQQHRQQLDVNELGRLIREAVQSTTSDKKIFERWLSKSLDKEALIRWIDEDVRAK